MRRIALASVAAAALVACGGGNPLGNPDTVANPPLSGNGQKLSFRYFQKCVQPIFDAQIPIDLNGAISINSCAGSGCHDAVSGTGGALRVIGHAAEVDLANPANTADVVRATEMYRNFYSAQGEVVLGSATSSRLLAKPLLLNVLHGGGLIFHSADDPMAKILRYWIEHPMPAGQDEFSTAGDALFTPPDAATGTCNTD